MTDLHLPALRRWKSLINRSEEVTWCLCNNDEVLSEQFWFRCPTFDADPQRLDLEASFNEFMRLSTAAQTLLRATFKETKIDVQSPFLQLHATPEGA